MTPKDLPAPVAAYIAATNAFNIDALMATFAENALVNDHRNEFDGRDAIRSWAQREIIDDRVTMHVTNARRRGNSASVSTNVDGNFDKTGLPDPLEVSLAKCTANEMAKRVSDLAMQLHGGNGYTEEYGLERLHRDAHGWAVAGGTPAMQRIRIVAELLGRRFDQRR